MRIGIDIDDVMYHWDKTARYMLREVLPNSPYLKSGPLGKESTRWNYIKDSVTEEHWDWLWKEGVQLGLFRHGHMYPGTIQAIRRLAKVGEIIVITHRPKQAVTDTMAWLSFQQLPLSGIHVLTNLEPKSSVVPYCDIYIDDKPENCEDLSKVGMAFMMDRGWNQHSDFPYRVRSWADFERAVAELT